AGIKDSATRSMVQGSSLPPYQHATTARALCEGSGKEGHVRGGNGEATAAPGSSDQDIGPPFGELGSLEACASERSPDDVSAQETAQAALKAPHTRVQSSMYPIAGHRIY